MRLRERVIERTRRQDWLYRAGARLADDIMPRFRQPDEAASLRAVREGSAAEQRAIMSEAICARRAFPSVAARSLRSAASIALAGRWRAREPAVCQSFCEPRPRACGSLCELASMSVGRRAVRLLLCSRPECFFNDGRAVRHHERGGCRAPRALRCPFQVESRHHPPRS